MISQDSDRDILCFLLTVGRAEWKLYEKICFKCVHDSIGVDISLLHQSGFSVPACTVIY